MTAILGSGRVFTPEVVLEFVSYNTIDDALPTFWLLIDAVAQILAKLLQFQNLTYFLTSWLTYLTFDLETLQTSVLSQDTCVG